MDWSLGAVAFKLFYAHFAFAEVSTGLADPAIASLNLSTSALPGWVVGTDLDSKTRM
jgi:hypothetical protein